MLRIYLDQNKWIDLARAAAGHAKSERFLTTLNLAKEVSKRGMASFPLSRSHHMEIGNQSSPQRRIDLVSVMYQLANPFDSGFPDSIAPFDQLFGAELDRALYRRFGNPRDVRPLQPFGKGLGHAHNDPSLFELELPDVFADEENLPTGFDPAAFTSSFKQIAMRTREWWLWTWNDEMLGDFRAEAEEGNRAYQQLKNSFSNRENQVSNTFVEQEVGKPGKADALAMDTLGWFFDELRDGLQRVNLSTIEQQQIVESGWASLVDEIPIANAYHELRSRRHDDPNRVSDPNDMEDMAWLSAAVVYCDVIVMEKYWAEMTRRAKLEEKHGTRILTRLNDLDQTLNELLVI